MARERRRPIYYTAITLHDGTVTSAFPIRRPSKQALKQDGRRIDPDGVARGHASNGLQYTASDDPGRFRFMDIMATRLNTRRALRELVFPRLDELHDDLIVLRAQLDRIEAMVIRLYERSVG